MRLPIAPSLALLLLLFGVLPGGAANAQCAVPHSFTNGQVADATQLMANFNALLSCIVPSGAANSVQYNSGAGVLAGVGPLTDGQVLIGSTGNPPQAQTLTAGTGVSITNGPGSVTVASTATVGLNGLYRQVMSATPTAASTGLANWVNQGTRTVVDGPTGFSIVSPSHLNISSIAGLYKAAPTPPYKIKALVSITRNTSAYNHIGLGWYDGTNKLQFIDFVSFNGSSNVVEVMQWNTPFSGATTLFTTPANSLSQPIWLQIEDDGTNVSFAFSQDGANFLTVYSSAKSTGFLGATGYSNVVVTINPLMASGTVGTVMSWTEY